MTLSGSSNHIKMALTNDLNKNRRHLDGANMISVFLASNVKNKTHPSLAPNCVRATCVNWTACHPVGSRKTLANGKPTKRNFFWKSVNSERRGFTSVSFWDAPLLRSEEGMRASLAILGEGCESRLKQNITAKRAKFVARNDEDTFAYRFYRLFHRRTYQTSRNQMHTCFFRNTSCQIYWVCGVFPLKFLTLRDCLS
jgi:hypothetical protein